MKNNQCCTGSCNQGRNCPASGKSDRSVVIVATLLLICIVAMCFGFYRLINGNAGQECAIEVQFKDSKATYIGTTV
jgi:hypothetical protein